MVHILLQNGPVAYASHFAESVLHHFGCSILLLKEFFSFSEVCRGGGRNSTFLIQSSRPIRLSSSRSGRQTLRHGLGSSHMTVILIPTEQRGLTGHLLRDDLEAE